jgi:hypothetical protein
LELLTKVAGFCYNSGQLFNNKGLVMAHTQIYGLATHSLRIALARESDQIIRRATRLGKDPRAHTIDALRDVSVVSAYSYYVVVKCDPEQYRLANGQAIANNIRDKIRKIKPEYAKTGVWLDLGFVRFWAG